MSFMKQRGYFGSKLAALVLAACVALSTGQAQTRIYETNVLVETVAGSGFFGYLDGVGTMTMFNLPTHITVDRMTNVYVWDSGNRRIRKVGSDGTVSTFAGSGLQERTDGTGTNASFYEVSAIAAAPDGSLVVADAGYIRTVSQQGVVTSLSSPPSGNANGPIAQASFSYPITGLGIDDEGTIFTSDFGHPNRCRIRRISTNWIVSTLAGSGNCETVDGVGIFCSFSFPYGVSADRFGNLYVAEFSSGGLMRKISPGAVVTTFAGGSPAAGDGLGTNATVGGLNIACDALGNIYVAAVERISRVSPEGRVTTLAGDWPSQGFKDGEGQTALFYQARWLAIDPAGRVLVADSMNHRIRRITYSPVPTTGLGIALYPGLSVTGALGKSFRIEYASALTNASNWTTATTLTLSNSPTLWFDTSDVGAKRFYRAVALP